MCFFLVVEVCTIIVGWDIIIEDIPIFISYIIYLQSPM